MSGQKASRTKRDWFLASVDAQIVTNDHLVDLLVVGSGNGALTAALCAYEFGIKHVLVIEKTDQYGGMSATSGGMVWIPCNREAHELGAQDSAEEAYAYLKRSTPSNTVPDEMLETYVREAPRMIQFLQARTRARYRTLAHLREYGELFSRSMEPEPLCRHFLGSEGNSIRDSHRMHAIADRIVMTAAETLTLLARRRGWRRLLARLLREYVRDVPRAFTHRRSRRLACGAAGIARLRWSMIDRGIPLWLNSRMHQLLTDETGRVVGAMVNREGNQVEVRARHGVVLGTGGFEHNQAMREHYLPKPTSFEWSAAAGANTGDGLRAGIRVGAAVHMMQGGYWSFTFTTPDHPIPWLARIERSYPGSCVVNRSGLRIENESQDSIDFQRALFARHSVESPQVPVWLIFDARFRRKYLVGPLRNSRLRPDWMLPKEYFASGFVTRADSIRNLAESAGINADVLSRTVATMNGYARTGVDLEFQRGEAQYDRLFADPSVKPNPCLAPIAEAPFYAVRMEPGDFGTQGGLSTDTHARVLNGKGEPIPGLYAVGNCAAPICPTYPSGGCTLGPAMTFAWQAAQHIAASVQRSGAVSMQTADRGS